MRVFVFAQAYPVPYKPYYDTQFEDLLRQGHDLHIFATTRDPGTVNEKVRRAGLEPRIRLFPATARQVLPILPGIAVGALMRPPLLGRALRAAARAGIRGLKRRMVAVSGALTLGPHNPDFILVHGLGTMSMLPWLRARYPDVPLAMYYHGAEVPGVPELPLVRTTAAFRQADAVFTNTRFSQEQAIARGCEADKVDVLPVGFDFRDYRIPNGRRYRASGKLHLVSAGRISEEKGLTFALEAVRHLVASGQRAIEYTIVGDGYHLPVLREYVAHHGLAEHVRFAGVLPNSSLIDEMQRADVLVLPSVPFRGCAETQACVVQEAMLTGAIVVTTTIGGVPESIAPEMAQFAVPPTDGMAIADALQRVMALSEVELRALGDAGRRFVQSRYDVRRLDEELIAATLRMHERRKRAAQ